jgi:hypothetical protein
MSSRPKKVLKKKKAAPSKKKEPKQEVAKPESEPEPAPEPEPQQDELQDYETDEEDEEVDVSIDDELDAISKSLKSLIDAVHGLDERLCALENRVPVPRELPQKADKTVIMRDLHSRSGIPVKIVKEVHMGFRELPQKVDKTALMRHTMARVDPYEKISRKV